MEEEINGFYVDYGTKLNTDLYTKPELCLICKLDDDPFEEILCILNRLGQRNEEDFKCGDIIQSMTTTN